MKKFILACCLAVCSIATISAESHRLENEEGKEENVAKTGEIVQSISNLLKEINRAYAEGTQPDFSALNISSDAQESLSMLWRNVNFKSMEEEIDGPFMTVNGGCQVRNLPLMIRPAGSDKQDGTYQEAVVNLDPMGQITGFRFAISDDLYREVIKEGAEVSDMHRRQMILDYVEKLYTAYYEKDIEFLAQAFGNDAILISGKVTQVKKTDWPISENKVSYSTQNKDQYIAGLRRIFGMTNEIQAFIRELKIQRHPTVQEAYGVQLRLGYSTNYHSIKYEDEGYLFLLWDFSDLKYPMIRIRTWQPYWMDENKTQHIDKDDIYDIGDFDFDRK